MDKSGIRMIEEDTYEQYYSLQTVAKMFEISEKTLRRIVRDKGIELIRIGGSIRFPESEISKLFESVPSVESMVNELLL